MLFRSRRLADSYQSGKRAKALKRMSGKPFCNSLEEAVRNYRTKKEKEQKLLDLIREGMALITPESPNLTDYLYDWAYEEERDFYPVGMESQVMLVYSTRDTLAECMEGFMNSDYQETYEVQARVSGMLTSIISTSTGKLMIPSSRKLRKRKRISSLKR